MTSSPPPPRTQSKGNFDEINLVEGNPAAAGAVGNGGNNGGSGSSSPNSLPRRQNTNQSNPEFYSLAHGCSVDDMSSDDDEEEETTGERAKEEGHQQAAKTALPDSGAIVPAAPTTIGTQKSPGLEEAKTQKEGTQKSDGVNANHIAQQPQPQQQRKHPGQAAAQSRPKQQQQQTQAPPPGTTGPSPPPIYTTVYPPGIYSAAPPGHVPPAYMPPPTIVHHQIPQSGPAYIIDASALHGMPAAAVLIRQSNAESAQAVAPVLVITEDPYSEYARRRRAVAILTFMLCFFPMVFFLLVLLSTIRDGYGYY